MQRPNVDDDLTLLTDVGKTEAIVVEVLDNPATEEGVLLKVMTRGPFEQGSRSGSLIVTDQKSATVENVVQQTVDSEVTLSTILPAAHRVSSDGFQPRKLCFISSSARLISPDCRSLDASRIVRRPTARRLRSVPS